MYITISIQSNWFSVSDIEMHSADIRSVEELIDAYLQLFIEIEKKQDISRMVQKNHNKICICFSRFSNGYFARGTFGTKWRNIECYDIFKFAYWNKSWHLVSYRYRVYEDFCSVNETTENGTERWCLYYFCLSNIHHQL